MMTNKTSDYDLTVIVPVYNERGNMLRLETALSTFLKKSKVKSCILFVNDGSQDGSGDLIREICRRNKDFFYIGLAKNCGLGAAMKAGIDYTCSRLVGYIDADLQTTPEDFNLLLEYTDDYGKIEIEFSSDIVIKNYPTRIDSDILNNIKKPFVSSNMSKSRGMGMYIVESLLDDCAYGFSVDYENEIFTIIIYKN